MGLINKSLICCNSLSECKVPVPIKKKKTTDMFSLNIKHFKFKQKILYKFRKSAHCTIIHYLCTDGYTLYK